MTSSGRLRRRIPRAVSDAVALACEGALLVSCSSAGTTTQAAAASSPSASLATGVGSLPSTWLDRRAVRGERVLVPEGWTMFSIDGGGSGSSSIWINPDDPGAWIQVADGVEAGAWCEVDGVAGSIDPEQLLPASATIDRLSQGTFAFSYPGTEFVDFSEGALKPVAPATVHGVWIASPACSGYEQLTYSLPGQSRQTIDALVRDFEQRNPLMTVPAALQPR